MLTLIIAEAPSGLRTAPYSCSKRARRGPAPRPASRRQFGIGVPPRRQRARPALQRPRVLARRSPCPPSQAPPRRGIIEGGERNSAELSGVKWRRRESAATAVVRRPKLYELSDDGQEMGRRGAALWLSQHSGRGCFCRPSKRMFTFRPSFLAPSNGAQVVERAAGAVVVAVVEGTGEDRMHLALAIHFF